MVVSRGFLLTLCSNLCMKSSGFEPRKCLIHCTSCLGGFYLVHLVCCSFVNTADIVHPASPLTGWCSYLCKSTGTSTQYQALSFLSALLCSPPCLPLTRDLLKGLIPFNTSFSTYLHGTLNSLLLKHSVSLKINDMTVTSPHEESREIRE